MILRTVFRQCTLYCLLAIAASRAEAQKVQIGVSLPLSGAESALGTDLKEVLRFAVADLAPNEIELVFEDDRCESRTAETVAKKLTLTGKIKLVIGLTCDEAARQAAPIYQSAGVTVISPLLSNSAIVGAFNNLYSFFPTQEEASELLYKMIAREEQKVAVLSDSSMSQEIYLDELNKLNTQKRFELVPYSLSTDPTASRKTLLSMKLGGSDAVVFLIRAESTLAELLEQFMELDGSARRYTFFLPASTSFQQLARNTSEGITFVTLPRAEEFLTHQGREAYGKFRQEHAALQGGSHLFYLGYESVNAFVTMLHWKRELPRELAGVRLEGIFGGYQFRDNGTIVGIPYVVQRFEGGQPLMLRLSSLDPQ